jgi:short subunit dehydrogenase-like uncharacterized protein
MGSSLTRQSPSPYFVSAVTARAPILVHGATGFTGGLVCDVLSSRGMSYAVSGRSPERLERLRHRLAKGGGAPPVELCAIDVTNGHMIREAIAGRRIVLACAGPFVEVGEPMLAECARMGVHYVDTTGEQRFVADASRRYGAIAEESGACLVPAMAYEIAPADWACSLASERLGGSPDTIDVFYSSRPIEGTRGGGTTRGTKKSMLRVIGEREPLQFIDGALVFELSAEKTTSFALPNGRRLAAASFPSPEAIVVPQHTGARTVRTYMAMAERVVRTLHRVRKIAPSLLRATRSLADRLVDGTAAGPEGAERGATFTIIAEATKGNERSRVALTGKDPYGLTAQLQVFAAERAVAGAITARGVVGPSVAFASREAIAALAHTGLSLA